MSEFWYALHVRARFERHVRKNLEYKGYETLLPTYESSRNWSDRVKSLSLPLFPNYVFCRFDLNGRLPILVTPGVNFIVGAGRSPVPISAGEVAAIRHILESGVPARPHRYVNVGEVVRIAAGPLEGLTGIVVRTKGCDRLIVSVTLLMRSVSVEIDREWIKAVEPAPRGSSIQRDAQIVTS